MHYNHEELEAKWQQYWAENQTFKAENNSDKPKYYVLDMFPYPSGAGLHVGHPLGYIASDIYARYKRHKGFNVLHPQGYDSFGLPAEQYAIQTGQHPAVTTEANIKTYRRQLDQIGFSFDWSREVRTSEPKYYKWTQWVFIQLFNSWYNKDSDKAEDISTLIAAFEKEGNTKVNASADDDLEVFSADEWNAFSNVKKQEVLLKYRLTFLSETEVNWCPALGTVLANDEIVNGVSERGGHPVVRKKMKQWSMRISAYAQRLLDGLETIDWPQPLKDIQTNWIGRSEGAMVSFNVDGHDAKIDVFTTRPDTIFGVSFMTLAPEHELVSQIVTSEQKEAVEAYIEATAKRSERDRMADVKTISGVFTGAYAIHPFSGEKVQIWIGDYVLASYGAGAVMAVPCGDERDYAFAKHFDIPIPNIFEGIDISEEAFMDKEKTIITNSDFLNGLTYKKAMKTIIYEIEKRGVGYGKVNYRLRDAVFSRQRYWGEPFPVYYKDGMPQMINTEYLPIVLPEVEKYLPTEDGRPPLGNADVWAWDVEKNQVVSNELINHTSVFPLELNTMPGWAGSSQYFNRYMDPQNDKEIFSRETINYWQDVDLYIGGVEHATGHLLYSRFWQKFMFDKGYVPTDEFAKKLINQGMIIGNSAFLHKIGSQFYRKNNLNTGLGGGAYVSEFLFGNNNTYISKDLIEEHFEPVNNDGIIWYSNEKLQSALRTEEYFTYLKENWIGRGIDNFINDYTSNPDDFICLFDMNYQYKSRVELDLINDETSIVKKNDVLGKSYLLEKDFNFFNDLNELKCTREPEKMSKSKYNVVNPDAICEQYGADSLRLYEMFLGPLEQSKPWNTAGITGVHGFLKKLWKLYHSGENGVFYVDNSPPTEGLGEAFKTLHKTIKKVEEDIENFSFNTSVSTFMIAVNELTAQKCTSRAILEPLLVLISPYAPHITEELWNKLGHENSIAFAKFPKFEEKYLVESSKNYPISFNGKMRFTLELPLDFSKEQIEEAVLAHEKTQAQLQGREPKKVIVVPGKIVNIVG